MIRNLLLLVGFTILLFGCKSEEQKKREAFAADSTAKALRLIAIEDSVRKVDSLAVNLKPLDGFLTFRWGADSLEVKRRMSHRDGIQLDTTDPAMYIIQFA